MPIEKISVVGASGNVGALVLPELLKSDISVTALSLTKVFGGEDAVISMLPMTALAEQAIVIDAAIAAGVKRFIPSEYGSDSTNQAIVAAVPLFEGKKKSLDYLSSKEDAISWTALITGPLFDWAYFASLMGYDLSTKTATLVDGGNTRFSTSNGAQIGRALVAVLQHDTATANKVVFVESFTTTQLEALAALEKISGEKWKVVEKKSEDIRAEGFKALGEGNIYSGGAALITALVHGKEALEDHSSVEGGIWNDRLGLPKENLEEVVRKIFRDATK